MTEIIPSNQSAIDQAAGDLLAAWHAALTLSVKAGDIAQNTADAYKRGVGKFIAWNDQAPVTPERLTQWKAALLEAGKKPATVNAWLAGVRALYTWAMSTGRLVVNPTAGIKGAKRKGTSKKHARESLTDLEVKRVLDQAKGSRRDYAILSLMLYTGVRSVEVTRADLGDLRTEGGRLVLYVTGKGHSEADELVVIAHPSAQNALYDWIAERGQAPGPLFVSQSDRNSGERLSLRTLRGMVKKYYQLAGVTGNKTTHSLRHTAITKVIQKSGSPVKAQSVARHKSIETTMIYFHEADRLENPGEAFIDYEG